MPDADTLRDKKSNPALYRNRCRRCLGRKYIGKGVRQRVCPDCGGSGTRPYNPRKSSTRTRKISQLTDTEIAGYAAMAGISDLEWKAVQLYYLNQESLVWPLSDALYVHVLELKRRQGWPVYRDRQAYRDPIERRLALMAVWEMAHPALFRVKSERGERAKISTYTRDLGVDRKTWHRVWKHRYRPVKEIVDGWLVHGLAGIEAVI